jgi:hypothetical protein
MAYRDGYLRVRPRPVAQASVCDRHQLCVGSGLEALFYFHAAGSRSRAPASVAAITSIAAACVTIDGSRSEDQANAPAESRQGLEDPTLES